jgi:hypothetical protein
MKVAFMTTPVATTLRAVCVCSILISVFGSGVAVADDAFAGKTYGEAEKALKGSGITPLIVTRAGDILDDEQCMVIRSQLRQMNDKPVLQVYLNCNANVAAKGKPGNSAASPQGKAALNVQATADYINANPEACASSEKAAADCKAFCDANEGMCTVPVG